MKQRSTLSHINIDKAFKIKSLLTIGLFQRSPHRGGTKKIICLFETRGPCSNLMGNIGINIEVRDKSFSD